MEIKKVFLKDYTSLKIGGEVSLVAVASEHDIQDAVKHAKTEGLRVHILGHGSNTYFSEHLTNFFVIKNEIKGISLKLEGKNCFLRVGAGELWDDIVKFTVENDLWGIENLSHIPGSVGAAPVQNIGAYGSELADVFVSLTAFDIGKSETVEMSKDVCQFGYRDSIFKQKPQNYIILFVTLKLSKESKPILTYKPLDSLKGKDSITLQEIRDLVIQVRKAKLPDWKEYPNAGSFFKNPTITFSQGDLLKEKYKDIPAYELENGYKIPAAWLIEKIAEMKGARKGSIGTWPMQPLVIVNYDKATSEELSLFAEEIIEKVKTGVNIHLEKEVNFVT